MKPTTSDDIFSLIDSSVIAAALGTAMESGLFWILAQQPLEAQSVAHELNIPQNRCGIWLQMLCSYDLLEQTDAGYVPSTLAQTAILDVYSQDTWAFLARESRQRVPAVRDLAQNIHVPGSVWDVIGLTPPDYLRDLQESPLRARQFTRMLYEIHLPLAAALADSLDMQRVDRMLDLGGGSGVMSLALLVSNPQLTAVVFDIPNVCAAGREIASENAMEDRITYQAGDFIHDELPSGFDLVLNCDVGIYTETMFRKIRSALNPGGRLVIVDKYAPTKESAHPTRLHWALLSSLENPDRTGTTTGEVENLLTQTGFKILYTKLLTTGQTQRWSKGWEMIEACMV
jgi:ubiquinone/menaquinone biosynthesis C-methylase UbiE